MLTEILTMDQAESTIAVFASWLVVGATVVGTAKAYDHRQRRYRKDVLNFIDYCEHFVERNFSTLDEQEITNKSNGERYRLFIGHHSLTLMDNPYYQQWFSNGGFDLLVLRKFPETRKKVPIPLYESLTT